MSPDLSPTTSSPRVPVPRLLIADQQVPSIESLIRIFDDRRLDVEYDVCTSPRSAVQKLLASPYQLIISEAQLAERENALLFKQAQQLDTFVPFVLTASSGEKDSARACP